MLSVGVGVVVDGGGWFCTLRVCLGDKSRCKQSWMGLARDLDGSYCEASVVS